MIAGTEAAARCERVDLVEEEDRRRDLTCTREQAGNLPFRVAIPFREQVRRLGADEVRLGLAGDGASDERLSRTRRAEEEEALRRPDSERRECGWIAKR